jgi:hypothetical protein
MGITRFISFSAFLDVLYRLGIEGKPYITTIEMDKYAEYIYGINLTPLEFSGYDDRLQ